jgi:hypothetical protein
VAGTNRLGGGRTAMLALSLYLTMEWRIFMRGDGQCVLLISLHTRALAHTLAFRLPQISRIDPTLFFPSLARFVAGRAF